MRLPSLRNLELISFHCTIEEDKGPINPIVEFTNSYPNQFDRVGHFKSVYHIVLNPDHHPMIHAPRICPLHLRDEIEKELKPWNPKALLETLASLLNRSAAYCTFERRMENFAYV